MIQKIYSTFEIKAHLMFTSISFPNEIRSNLLITKHSENEMHKNEIHRKPLYLTNIISHGCCLVITLPRRDLYFDIEADNALGIKSMSFIILYIYM